MSKITYADKLKDPRWRKKRLIILNRDNFTCQRCGDTKKSLHVHHFCYNRSYNPWDVSDDALTTLCCDCHKIDHLNNLTKLEELLIENIQLLLPPVGHRSECMTSVYKEIMNQILKLKSNG